MHEVGGGGGAQVCIASTLHGDKGWRRLCHTGSSPMHVFHYRLNRSNTCNPMVPPKDISWGAWNVWHHLGYFEPWGRWYEGSPPHHLAKEYCNCTVVWSKQQRYKCMWCVLMLHHGMYSFASIIHINGFQCSTTEVTSRHSRTYGGDPCDFLKKLLHCVASASCSCPKRGTRCNIDMLVKCTNFGQWLLTRKLGQDNRWALIRDNEFQIRSGWV